MSDTYCPRETWKRLSEDTSKERRRLIFKSVNFCERPGGLACTSVALTFVYEAVVRAVGIRVPSHNSAIIVD
jgi:hypothetical protein